VFPNAPIKGIYSAAPVARAVLPSNISNEICGIASKGSNQSYDNRPPVWFMVKLFFSGIHEFFEIKIKLHTNIEKFN
jgi:hypothetical protein